MRLTITIIAIIIFAAIAEWYGPWWCAAVVAGIAGFLSGLRTGKAFIAGFLSVALMWLIFFLVKDISNNHLLAQKMAEIFHLPSYLLYALVTILVGGITGGISCWAGAQLRKVFKPATFESAS